MTDRTIGDAAALLGVSTRTLRHWDTIGLLSPSWRTTTDYRLYTPADMDTAVQIMVYRAAGMPLRDIAEVLARPTTATEHLRRQRALLLDQITHLHRMVRAVDQILREDTMSTEKKAGLLREAEQRWGDTPEWKQSQQVQMDDNIREELDSFTQALIDAAAVHIAPGSPAGNRLALRHRASIGHWYEVTPAKHVILARMYVSDERFNETYRGKAEYLLALIEALVASEGVDVDHVEWS